MGDDHRPGSGAGDHRRDRAGNGPRIAREAVRVGFHGPLCAADPTVRLAYGNSGRGSGHGPVRDRADQEKDPAARHQERGAGAQQVVVRLGPAHGAAGVDIQRLGPRRDRDRAQGRLLVQGGER